MNSKIKNYVDVLFKEIPNTQKSRELKEEILSSLNDHFQEHIAEGKSENQAYTEALQDLGDIDELLKGLEPERDLKTKIDSYRVKRARNISIAVMLYILSVVVLIGTASISTVFNIGDEEKFGVIGLIGMFLLIAAATGLIIYTKMSMPQDVAQYISKESGVSGRKGSGKVSKGVNAFMSLYWMIVLIAYLGLSFATGAWYITWIIWLIATAIKNAIYCFFNIEEDDDGHCCK